MSGIDSDLLAQSLLSFCNSPSWEEKRDVLIAHPELLSDEALSLLDYWIEKARMQGEGVCEQKLTFDRLILNECRSVGIDITFTELREIMPTIVLEDGRSYIEYDPQALKINTEKLEAIIQLEAITHIAEDDIHVIHNSKKLTELITLYKDALNWKIAILDNEYRANLHTHIGRAYRKLSSGNIVQRLRRSIGHLNCALNLFPPEANPKLYANIQNELGLVYLNLPTGDQTENLARAITSFEEALRFRTTEKDCLEYAATENNLGMAFTRLAGMDRNPQINLFKSINHFRRALNCYRSEDIPERCALVDFNLGKVYLDLGEADHSYLLLAMSSYRNALDVWTEKAAFQSYRAIALIFLGKVYASSLSSSSDDPSKQRLLNLAISYIKEGLEILKREDNPHHMAIGYEELGKAYLTLSDGSQAENMQCALENYRRAMDFLPLNTFPKDRRRIALEAGDIYFEQRRWEDAIDTYREAVVANDVLYRIASTELSRREEISQTEGLFNNFAYALAQLKRYEEATVHLEAGRTQILAEIFSRNRASLESLKTEDKIALETAWRNLKALEAEVRAIRGTDLPQAAKYFAEISSELRTARKELNRIVKQIRDYAPEFMPKNFNFGSIATAAARPIVYLITTSLGSLALIIPPGAEKMEAKHALLLDDFSTEDLSDLLAKLPISGEYFKVVSEGKEGLLISSELGGSSESHAVLSDYLKGMLDGDEDLLKSGLDKILPVLRDQLIGPLIARLGDLGFDQAIVIPGGKLSLLPLHAACFDKNIFAYAPSARALQMAGNVAEQRSGISPIFLGIGNPMPSNDPLRFARDEVEVIASYFDASSRCLLVEGQATLEETKKRSRGATHIHFACHGLFDVTEPLNSSLDLSGDDKLTLRDLLGGSIDLSSSRLVVLSACQTGITEFLKAPDEAVGFPAGFLQAGVPGLISTLWPVEDISTALLLDHFYKCLMDPKERIDAATALHKAQDWLRKSTADEMNLAKWYERRYEASGNKDAEAYKYMRHYRAKSGYMPFTHPYYWAGFIFTGVGPLNSEIVAKILKH